MEDASVDAIVTDPPYGLAFMGKTWDHGVPGVPFWKAALRVAKPGRTCWPSAGRWTFHRLACAIEDAGWEIRDCIMWVYGQGFPKSLDVSKAIDRAAGAKRRKVQPGNPPAYGRLAGNSRPWMDDPSHTIDDENPVTAAAAAAAAGRGTALKPAWEPVFVCRKPLNGTVSETVQKHGTGSLNIDACRIPFSNDNDKAAAAAAAAQRLCQNNSVFGGFSDNGPASISGYLAGMDKGRWPANVIHDGSEETLGLFPESQSRPEKSCHREMTSRGYKGGALGQRKAKDHPWVAIPKPSYADRGSAARFFYCAKASRKERGDGNTHPTVKPLALMRYLCRLVTPPGGLILDPFMGSGTTGKAARVEGFRFVGIEKEKAYLAIARKRIQGAKTEVAVAC